jgi:Kazal-type serine protease inhibitor domain
MFAIPTPDRFMRLLLLGASMASFTSNASAQSGSGVSALPGVRRPIFCTEQYAPVCGRVGAEYKTYSNSCLARAAGAKIVQDGRCPIGRMRQSPE